MSSDPALPPEVFAQVSEAWAVQDYSLGEQLLAKACARYPGHQHLRVCHAASLGYCARYRDARAAFEELLRQAPPERRLHLHALLGIEWCRIGRHDLAEPLLRIAAEARPAPPPVLHALADALLRLQRIPEALELLQHALAQYHGYPGLLLMKARALRLQKDPEQAAAIARQVIASQNAAVATKAEAGHELGHALDAMERYREAFMAFQAAKVALRPEMEKFLPIWRGHLNGLRQTNFQPNLEDYERWASAATSAPPLSGSPAFLTGAPRSGTTLLERALQSHPLLSSASETPVFNNIWNPHLRAAPTGVGLRNILSSVTADELKSDRARYWENIEQALECSPAGRVALDKNPSAMANVPAISRFFPEAKLLVSLRDPRAVAWSCYTQFLPINGESAAFNRFDTLGDHLVANYQFWLHARERLPSGTWRECRYEAVVSNFEPELRGILAFLGLPWDPAVASHHASRAPVRSPTYAEASQPIYSRALENWRHYEEFIGDASEKLNSILAPLGYGV